MERCYRVCNCWIFPGFSDLVLILWKKTHLIIAKLAVNYSISHGTTSGFVKPGSDLTPWSCGRLLFVCDCYQDLGKDGDGKEQTVAVEPCDLKSSR